MVHLLFILLFFDQILPRCWVWKYHAHCTVGAHLTKSQHIHTDCCEHLTKNAISNPTSLIKTMYTSLPSSPNPPREHILCFGFVSSNFYQNSGLDVLTFYWNICFLVPPFPKLNYGAHTHVTFMEDSFHLLIYITDVISLKSLLPHKFHIPYLFSLQFL